MVSDKIYSVISKINISLVVHELTRTTAVAIKKILCLLLYAHQQDNIQVDFIYSIDAPLKYGVVCPQAG